MNIQNLLEKYKIDPDVTKDQFFVTDGSLIKRPDPVQTKNLGLFLRQCMYQHEQQLVKNSLMEGIIKYSRLVHKKNITKNEARQMVTRKISDKNLLEKFPDNPEIYKLVEEKFTNS